MSSCYPRTLRNPSAPSSTRSEYRSQLIRFLIGIVLLASVGQPISVTATSPPDAEFHRVMPFNIPPQSLTAALNAFAETMGWQVSFPADIATGMMSSGVGGDHSAEAALQQLLAGTGLTYQFTDPKTFTLVRDNETPVPLSSGDTHRKATSHSPVDSRKKSSSPKAVKVPEIVVKEVRERGFVAGETHSATKTDAPLVETPQSITVITRNRIVTQEVDSMAEALRYTAGVQSETFGFEPRFTWLRFRGFDSTTNGLFKDGMQLRNPGFAVSYNLEPYGAEQVDVLRGPASFLYGQSSPGGLLNYISKRPTMEPLRELKFLAGSFDRYEGRFDFGGRLLDNDAFSFRLTGLFRESGTQIDHVSNDRVYIAPALTFQATPDTFITFFANFQKDQLGSSQALPAEGTLFENANGTIPPSRFTGIPDLDKQNRTEWSVGYEFQHRFNESWRFLQKLRYNWTELDGFTVFSTGLEADKRTVTRSAFGSLGTLDALTVDNQLHGTFGIGPLQNALLAGVDFQRITVDLTQTFGPASSIDIFNRADFGAPITMPSVFLNQDTTQYQLGLYIQDQIKLYEKIMFTVGGRYDWAENETEDRLTGMSRTQTDRKATTRLALSYLFDFGLVPYVSYSTFFLPAIGVDPSGDAFDPETGRQYEVGFKYQPPGSRSLLSIALFELTREDYVQTNPATFQQVQTGEARSRGVELEGIASFDFGMDLIANYTILDNEVRETANPIEKGKWLTQTPAQFGSIWVNYVVPKGKLKGFMIGGGARYTGSTYADTANTFRVSSFVVGDAMVAYTWDRYRFALNVTNILDHEIFSCFTRGATNFCPYGERRNFVGSITYRW